MSDEFDGGSADTSSNADTGSSIDMSSDINTTSDIDTSSDLNSGDMSLDIPDDASSDITTDSQDNLSLESDDNSIDTLEDTPSDEIKSAEDMPLDSDNMEDASLDVDTEAENDMSLAVDDNNTNVDKADAYVDTNLNSDLDSEESELDEVDISDENLDNTDYNDTNENFDEVKEQYIEDLKQRSEFPDTIDEEVFNNEWEKRDAAENAIMRDEFDDLKSDLIKMWEEQNSMEWPRYAENVYSNNDKLIRKVGNKYDAHHIQPLSLGGTNTAENITPLHALEHYDKQGIHSFDSSYSKIANLLKLEDLT